MGEFVKVAQVADIPPGRGRLVEVGGRLIALFNCAGTFYALDDTCTHAAASLSEGYLEGTAVECPLHGARFDLRTGAALWSPAFVPVATYAVRVDGPDVLVDPTPLEPSAE
jgi:3-phenylpropionate/trans-cinnamate dioxygenase ferredoxin subunit